MVDVRQNGCTRGIYNGNRAILPNKINLPTDRQGYSQPEVPRKKNIFRGAFNGGWTIFPEIFFNLFFSLEVKFLMEKGPPPIRCASLRAFRWYPGIQNRHYGRLAN